MGLISAVTVVALGLILLLILYLHGVFRDKIDYRIKDFPEFETPYFALTLMGFSNSLPTSGNPTNFWSEPDKIYAVRLAAIRNAQQTIHFETFFITPGRRANEFAAALMERAAAGVEVQLLADRFGSKKMSRKYWQRLESSGVQVRFFHPFDWKEPLECLCRTHRKILTVDGQVALIGGMGVSDDWDGRKEDTAPWLDCEIQFEGAIVTTIEGVFMQHWIYTGGIASLAAAARQPDSAISSKILVTASDADAKVSPISTLFWMSILAAKERVWIASPYFFLDANCRRALLTAKQKGVDVRVVTTGSRNDKKLVYYAVRECYGDLLAASIDIYEYQPSMIHAKLMLIDSHWVSLGSANFDPRSFFHNDELNFSLSEPKLTKTAENFFLSAFPKSSDVDLVAWKSRPLWQRFVGRLTLFFRWQL